MEDRNLPVPDICQPCPHADACRCVYSDEYDACRLREMGVEELISLVNQITGERDYYRGIVERKLKQKMNKQ